MRSKYGQSIDRAVSRTARRLDRKRAGKRYRMAEKILAVVRHAPPRKRFTPISIEITQTLQRLQRLGPMAESRGWQLAADRVDREYARTLKLLSDSVYQSLDALAKNAAPVCRCSLPEIIGDLAALDTDFESVELGVKDGTVSVTTERIELEGVLLGPFKIELSLRYLGQSHAYRVIATEPQAAATCDSTTHPHVQSETLCEGEGYQAIKHALADGRIHDFFVIVRQILQTYNANSAYISINDWFGVQCSDCGGTVDEDDSCACARCGGRTCNDCSRACDGCDESFCDDCTSICEGCRSYYCNGCLESCDRCDNSFCKHCLTENQCDDCLDQETNEEPTETSPETETSLQPLCVGETEILA